MYCNRDEATRAKSIAEAMFEQNDFLGAIKFALKAQTLSPGLDGISQMLATLDVFVSAEKKISGEVDWYGVLRVDPSADDDAIKKQYKKLALMLHPDKNRSVGADGAFKLVSEAKCLLLDKAKRSAYDQITGYQVFQQKVPTQTGGPSPHTGDPAAHTGGPWAHTDGPSAHTGGSWAQTDGPSAYTAPTAHADDPWAGPSAFAGGSCAHTGSPQAHTGGSWARAGGPFAYTGGPSAPPSTESPFFTFARRTNPRAPKPQRKCAKTPFRPTPTRRKTDIFWTLCHRCRVQFEHPKLFRNVVIICANCNKAFMAVEIPRPIGKSRSHKPKPWPSSQRNASDYLRTPNTNGRAPGTWQTWQNSSANVAYQQGPLSGTTGFDAGNPSMAAEEEEEAVAHYTEPDVQAWMEGFFKRRKMDDDDGDDYGGIFKNNYNAPQGNAGFGNEGTFGSGAYGFTGWCRV